MPREAAEEEQTHPKGRCLLPRGPRWLQPRQNPELCYSSHTHTLTLSTTRGPQVSCKSGRIISSKRRAGHVCGDSRSGTWGQIPNRSQMCIALGHCKWVGGLGSSLLRGVTDPSVTPPCDFAVLPTRACPLRHGDCCVSVRFLREGSISRRCRALLELSARKRHTHLSSSSVGEGGTAARGGACSLVGGLEALDLQAREVLGFRASPWEELAGPRPWLPPFSLILV